MSLRERRRVLILGSAAACVAPPLPMRPAHGGTAPALPAFSRWIGRTAVIRTDGETEARLFLAGNGTGAIAVRLGGCWTLPVTRWQMGPDGLTLAYLRRSALAPWQQVAGSAAIDGAAACVHWAEEGRRPSQVRLLRLEPGNTTAGC